ncbi:hypothetical protein FRUB_03321 [Fimbriiglobus ruber]|uniref:Uncharacterized protein n=2 Tax=Fimbriiglobus ruber TaxID=1908690 RepID=A0A225DQQ2_9BACT|nr:hypothetical protein FRUB_03321 [Fimbriiglobus ruber]
MTAPAAGVVLKPLSYTKPVADRKFVFVMLGNAEDEAEVKDETAKAQFRALREKYPKTGLYNGESATAVWAIDDSEFAPYDNTYPAADGVHFVRVEGDWWKTKDFTGGRNRLSADEETRQLDAPAVAFFASGKLLHRYTVRDLITNADELPHTPQHVLWSTGGVLNDATGRFSVFTHDSNRVTFDYRTGEVVARGKMGLGNPLLQTVLAVSGVLTLVILALWAWFVFRKSGTTAGVRAGSA